MTDSNNAIAAQLDSVPEAQPASQWAAVFSLAMGVFSLVMAEFLPASLLTPIATSMNVSEGLAGQTVAVTAFIALFSGLLAPAATRQLDRRVVLLVLSALLIVSNVLAGLAANLAVLLTARVMLGIALGAFWSLAAALAMRLVHERHVPRALSLVFTGVPLATVAAAALGSYLGSVLGWRNVFFAAAACGAATWVIQATTLPRLKPDRPTPLRMLWHVLKRPGISAGMIAIVLVFSGHFVFFTYIRPFLENVSGAEIDRVSLTLLGFGLANFAGTLAAGFLIVRSMRGTLAAMPLGMAGLAMTTVALGGDWVILDTVIVSLWGITFGAVPVAWSTWVTRVVPDEAESGGGLMGAAVQLAITTGAAVGGLLYDAGGIPTAFTAAAILLMAATVLIMARVQA